MIEIKNKTVSAKTQVSDRERVLTFHTDGLGAFCGLVVVPADDAESICSAINSGLCHETREAYGIHAVVYKEATK